MFFLGNVWETGIVEGGMYLECLRNSNKVRGVRFWGFRGRGVELRMERDFFSFVVIVGS